MAQAVVLAVGGAKMVPEDNEQITTDNWRAFNNCADADLTVFFPGTNEDDEPAYPTEEAKRRCNFCSVRPECLTWAIEQQIEFGTFGGMSGYQRGLLNKRQSRKRCPGCSSEEIELVGRHEACVACGASWDAGLLDDDDV